MCYAIPDCSRILFQSVIFQKFHWCDSAVPQIVQLVIRYRWWQKILDAQSKSIKAGSLALENTLSFARGLTLVVSCDWWMRYCDEEAITFDFAISGEKKEKKETIAEKRRRQRSQRHFQVLCKDLFAQKIQLEERVQWIKKVKNCCLQSVELGTYS